MGDLTTAMARAADTLSESLAQPCATGSQTRYGTVVANNGSTLDVAMAGGTVTGVLMTTACCSAVAGDRVLLDVTGPLVTATGILANSDNGPYVKPTVSTPFAGATLYRVDGIAVLQITNLTLSAGVIRTAGKLPVKLTLKAEGPSRITTQLDTSPSARTAQRRVGPPHRATSPGRSSSRSRIDFDRFVAVFA